MTKDEAIEELKSIGDYLNHKLGCDSYDVRCKIYDIRRLLMDEVKSTLAPVSDLVFLCKPNYKAKDGSIKLGIEINGKYYAPKNDL